MKKQYLYPQNMKTSAKLWFWNLRDIILLAVFSALSVLAWAKLGWIPPAAFTLVFAFLTIRADDTSVQDYLIRAWRFFVGTQQKFEWKEGQ